MCQKLVLEIKSTSKQRKTPLMQVTHDAKYLIHKIFLISIITELEVKVPFASSHTETIIGLVRFGVTLNPEYYLIPNHKST